MFQKILVAMDESDRSQQVLSEAIELAKLSHAAILLLHVLSTAEPDYPSQLSYPVTDIGVDCAFSTEMMHLYVQQLQEFEQRHGQRLQSFAKAAESQGVPVTWMQLFGSAGSEICRIAREEKVDLLIIGRRGHTGLKEALMGSVSNYVMHHAPCTVMVVQEKEKQKESSESIKQQAVTVG